MSKQINDIAGDGGADKKEIDRWVGRKEGRKQGKVRLWEMPKGRKVKIFYGKGYRGRYNLRMRSKGMYSSSSSGGKGERKMIPTSFCRFPNVHVGPA